MIKLAKMKLFNWYKFELFRDEDIINFGDTTAIVAYNGTGKTALSDAIRYAALGDSNFNQAADAKGRGRDLKSYIRGQKDREANTYYRPVKDMPNVTTHIALEWHDDQDGSIFVTGVVIDLDSNDTHVPKWYIMEDARLEDVPMVHEEDGKIIPENTKQFQGRAHVEMWDHNEGIHNILYRLGLHISMDSNYPDYLRKCRAIIKYDTEANIPEFIQNCILPKDDVSIGDLQEKIKSVREAKHELQNLQQESEILDQIIQKFDDLQGLQRRMLRDDIKKAYYEFDSKTEERNAELAAADADQIEKQQQERESVRLSGEIEDLNARQASIKQSIDENEPRRALENEKEHLLELQQKEDALQDKYNEVTAFQKELENMCAELPDDSIDSETKETLALLSTDQVSLTKKYEAINLVKKSVNDARDDVVTEGRNAKARLDDINAEQRRQDEIAENCRKYRTTYSRIPDYTALRDEINHELEKQGRKERAYLACECVSGFTDDAWQDAIEGFLGARRYTVLVDPEAYDVADAVFAKTKHKKAHLFNTERLMRKQVNVDEGSVVNLLDIPNAVGQQYFNYVLKHMIAVSEKEVKNYDNAIAKSGHVSNGLDNYYVAQGGLDVYYFGQESYKKNLAAAQKRLDELNAEEDEIKEIMRLTTDKRRKYDDFLEEFKDYDLDTCNELNEIEEEIQDSNQMITNLEAGVEQDEEYKELLTQQSVVAEDLGRLNRERTEADKEVGRLQSDITQHQNAAEQLFAEMNDAVVNVEKFQETYPQDAKAVEKDIEQGKKKPANERTRQNWSSMMNGIISKDMPDLQQKYKIYAPVAPFGTDDRRWYDSRKQVINTNDLPHASKKLQEETAREEEIFKTEFVYAIQDRCANIKRKMYDINKELKKHPIAGTKYNFWWADKKDCEFEEILRYAEDSKEVGDLTRATSEGQELDTKMNQILDKITNGDSKNSDKEFAQYADYRNYMDYDVKFTNEKGENISLSKQNGANSGAEVQIPYLLMLLSALLLTYGNADESDSMRLVIMDEPFTKMDSSKTRMMIDFMREQNFQAIFCTPKEDEAVIDASDQLLTMTKEEQTGYVYVEGRHNDCTYDSTTVLQGRIGHKDE